VTIIAHGNRFVGDIEVTGQLQVDGLMEGSIRAADMMTIGSQGSINGRIRGHLVQVAGQF
jgi:cytoskeletal protein CcmA (bactofilin family)